MPTELRNRKVAPPPPPPPRDPPSERIHKEEEEEDKSKQKSTPRRSASSSGRRKDEGPPDLEPNIWVVACLFLLFSLVVGTFVFYKIDNRDDGPFATWVKRQSPWIDATFNRSPALRRQQTLLFGAAAQETTLKLTEEELKAFTGKDAEQPIYLAIDGVIFDVSASPAFYGPGGHYHHFVGRDATRAWITECWDEEEQFTWRLDGVEAMFLPKWMDETIEAAGRGEFEGVEGLDAMPKDMLGTLAKKAMQKYGSITDGEKKERRKRDREEAEAKVKETLEHWKGFFTGNGKYKVVGEVVRDETRPAPPKPCAEAMKKRPTKGGKLESLMGAMGGMMGGMGGGGNGEKKGEMPDFVKQKLAEQKKAAEAETIEEVELEDDDDGLAHEEL
ncbi:Membrane steroid-binding 2 [Lecanosticta acicola]|uniref:Membrane steroid-binding 2 n=1 Tax=Lecanosticta acicola TaxID=111012 RepID=A0AAI9EFF6_9PEZI|nr:Membrane steroid-binding 2 [Lecanosticta acicola]